MPNNVFGGRVNLIFSKAAISFASAGLNTTNTNSITLFDLDGSIKSWKPNRTINGITDFVVDTAYYARFKTDLDLTAYVQPPFDGSGLEWDGSEW